MTGVMLVTAHGEAVMLKLRDGTPAPPTATICNQCGNVNISVDTQMIYSTFSAKH